MASLGHDGLNKLLAGHENKSAQAVCTFAYCKGPGEEPILFQGVTKVRKWQSFGGERCLCVLQRQWLTCVLNRARLCLLAARPTLVSFRLSVSFVQQYVYDHKILTSLIFFSGAGWDPIFEYEGETYVIRSLLLLSSTRTLANSHRYAEMDKAKKNTISHRYKALQQLRKYFAQQTSA